MMAAFTGHPEAEGLGFLDLIEAHKLTFAPKSFGPVLVDLGGKRCRLGAKSAKWDAWMDHEDLVLAPKSFEAVIADLVRIAQKHAA